MISIGNTIKTLRKAKGVTQEEVARELEFHTKQFQSMKMK